MYFKFFFKKIQSYELLVLGLCTRNVPRSRVPLITGILKEHTVPLSAWGRMHSHVKTGLLVFFFLEGRWKRVTVLIFAYTPKQSRTGLALHSVRHYLAGRGGVAQLYCAASVLGWRYSARRGAVSCQLSSLKNTNGGIHLSWATSLSTRPSCYSAQICSCPLYGEWGGRW